VTVPSARVDLPAHPATPCWARRHTAAILGAWQIDPDTVDTALLLVSEIITNAVTATTALPRHTTTSTPITQTLHCQDGQIIIEITDPSPHPPVLTDTGPDAETGRGLLLVHALAKEWTWHNQPDDGKTIRCALPVPDTTTQPGPPPAQPQLSADT